MEQHSVYRFHMGSNALVWTNPRGWRRALAQIIQPLGSAVGDRSNLYRAPSSLNTMLCTLESFFLLIQNVVLYRF